ncbi:MAG: hypothetical protein IJ317_05550 [Clostridia bacterium]|nr:hypothetical protein [Clostridia bacterium]
MTSVYTDADYLAAYKQKRKLFGIFMAITTVYLAFCVAWLVYYISLPYVANKFWPKACVYVASAVYAVFAWVYLSIKYSRIRRYYKMLGYVCDGLKVGETNYFYRFREKSLQKDNIDVVGCVFETYSRKKQEWMEREVYADSEKPLPEFGEGDLVRYVAQSNILIQYDILEKHAYEFEEYEEDEDEYEEADEVETSEAEQGEENE